MGAGCNLALFCDIRIASDRAKFCEAFVHRGLTSDAGSTYLLPRLVGLARRQGQAVVPGYTHLQRAQPVVFGHAVLAYVEMLQRDASRLRDLADRMDECPWAARVAGTSLPLDRAGCGGRWAFAARRNSIDATSDRDFLADLCYACAMIAVHLSRGRRTGSSRPPPSSAPWNSATPTAPAAA
jgi:1,4-dihydroxy-2-naphthoyl-CoA synthase